MSSKVYRPRVPQAAAHAVAARAPQQVVADDRSQSPVWRYHAWMKRLRMWDATTSACYLATTLFSSFAAMSHLADCISYEAGTLTRSRKLNGSAYTLISEVADLLARRPVELVVECNINRGDDGNVVMDIRIGFWGDVALTMPYEALSMSQRQCLQNLLVRRAFRLIRSAGNTVWYSDCLENDVFRRAYDPAVLLALLFWKNSPQKLIARGHCFSDFRAVLARQMSFARARAKHRVCLRETYTRHAAHLEQVLAFFATEHLAHDMMRPDTVDWMIDAFHATIKDMLGAYGDACARAGVRAGDDVVVRSADSFMPAADH